MRGFVYSSIPALSYPIVTIDSLGKQLGIHTQKFVKNFRIQSKRQYGSLFRMFCREMHAAAIPCGAE
jgi:hypothetical protein